MSLIRVEDRPLNWVLMEISNWLNELIFGFLFLTQFKYALTSCCRMVSDGSIISSWAVYAYHCPVFIFPSAGHG